MAEAVRILQPRCCDGLCRGYDAGPFKGKRLEVAGKAESAHTGLVKERLPEITGE